MEFILRAFDFLVHLSAHLDGLVSSYGGFVYLFLFLVVFLETGVVVAPFLPGDSLLFAAGAVASRGGLNVFILIVVFISASILGDMVNYWVGRFFGEKMLARYPRLVKPIYIERTRDFFARYGGKTIVLCRFVPMIRTIAPFLAGAGEMSYKKFTYYNVMGAVLWVFIFVPAGYFFANLPFVEENFTLVLLGVIFVSLLPAVIEVVSEWRRARSLRQKRQEVISE